MTNHVHGVASILRWDVAIETIAALHLQTVHLVPEVEILNASSILEI